MAEIKDCIQGLENKAMKKEIDKDINTLINNFKEIKCIVLFGSIVGGDYVNEVSDIDLAVIVPSKKLEKETEQFILKDFSYNYQVHIFTIKDFNKNLREGKPLYLSIVHTGKSVYGNTFFNKLRNIKPKPSTRTIEQCMLNSFAAAGLGLSDLTHGMLYDSVNSIYHSARSSLWALVMDKSVTPSNAELLKLIEDKKIRQAYNKIIKFRNNIPPLDSDLEFNRKMYSHGNFNEFTQLICDSNIIIKHCYKKILNANFVDVFQLLSLLKSKLKSPPDHYSINLSVDWDKMIPQYMVSLSFNKKSIISVVNAKDGKILCWRTIR